MRKSNLLLVLFLCGCATMFRGTEQQVHVNTTPQAAKVSFSTGSTCLSPCSINASRGNPLQVTITKDGYNTYTTTLVPTLAGSGAMLGGVFDYGTGAVYDLQPNPLHVILIPLHK